MKIKATIISPIHISSGNEYEKDFNFFIKNNEVYLIEEFDILDKFPNAYNKNNNYMVLKENIKQKIIDQKLYKRTIKTYFTNFQNKPIIEAISSNSNSYIPASSIKGAIRTAILNCLINYNELDYSKRCNEIYNSCINNCKIDITNNLDKNLVKIFQNIKIKEVYPKFKTQIYQTINIKICENYQKYREEKTKTIANFVEAIKPIQEFEFEIIDQNNILNKLGLIANAFYIPKINDDIFKIIGCPEELDECNNLLEENKFKNYFYKKGAIDISKLKGLGHKKFLLSISRFGGAIKKSVDNYRNIPNSHCDNKKFTTTKTFALDKPCEDLTYYENCLIPFGWMVCEIIEN